MKRFLFIILILTLMGFLGFSACVSCSKPDGKVRVYFSGSLLEEVLIKEYVNQKAKIKFFDILEKIEKNDRVFFVRDEKNFGIVYIVWVTDKGEVIKSIKFDLRREST